MSEGVNNPRRFPFISLFVALTCIPGATALADMPPHTASILVDGARLRSQDSRQSDANIKGMLYTGTQVTVLRSEEIKVNGHIEHWSLVKTAGSEQGWMNTKLLGEPSSESHKAAPSAHAKATSAPTPAAAPTPEPPKRAAPAAPKRAAPAAPAPTVATTPAPAAAHPAKPAPAAAPKPTATPVVVAPKPNSETAPAAPIAAKEKPATPNAKTQPPRIASPTDIVKPQAAAPKDTKAAKEMKPSSKGKAPAASAPAEKKVVDGPKPEKAKPAAESKAKAPVTPGAKTEVAQLVGAPKPAKAAKPQGSSATPVTLVGKPDEAAKADKPKVSDSPKRSEKPATVALDPNHPCFSDRNSSVAALKLFPSNFSRIPAYLSMERGSNKGFFGRGIGGMRAYFDASGNMKYEEVMYGYCKHSGMGFCTNFGDNDKDRSSIDERDIRDSANIKMVCYNPRTQSITLTTVGGKYHEVKLSIEPNSIKLHYADAKTGQPRDADFEVSDAGTYNSRVSQAREELRQAYKDASSADR